MKTKKINRSQYNKGLAAAFWEATGRKPGTLREAKEYFGIVTKGKQ